MKSFPGTWILNIQVPLFLLSHLQSTSPMVIKKVITDFDFSKASSTHWIPVVVLKNCGPDLSNISADLFIMCLKVSFFFLGYWKILFVLPVSHNDGKSSVAKTYCPVNLVFSKIFDKLLSNVLVDYLQKYQVFLLNCWSFHICIW